MELRVSTWSMNQHASAAFVVEHRPDHAQLVTSDKSSHLRVAAIAILRSNPDRNPEVLLVDIVSAQPKNFPASRLGAEKAKAFARQELNHGTDDHYTDGPFQRFHIGS